MRSRVDNEGDTLLHIPCDKRRYDIVKVLLATWTGPTTLPSVPYMTPQETKRVV